MNRAGLTTGSGASGGGRIMGAEASVHNKLVKVWGFVESDRGRFDEVVLGGWIRGKDVDKILIVYERDYRQERESIMAWFKN